MIYEYAYTAVHTYASYVEKPSVFDTTLLQRRCEKKEKRNGKYSIHPGYTNTVSHTPTLDKVTPMDKLL